MGSRLPVDNGQDNQQKPFLIPIKNAKHAIMGVVDPKMYEDALSYEPDDDDVFVSSFAKAGTTWLQAIVWKLMYGFDSPKDGTLPGLHHFLGYFASKEDIKKKACPRHIKCHLPFNLIPYNKNAKYLYVARNPFDVCVSHFKHTLGLNLYKFNGSFSDFFKLFMSGEGEFGDYFDHVLSWYEQKDDINVLFLTYEQMKLDIRSCIKQIGNFIGGHCSETVLNDDNIDELVKLTSFDEMKKRHEALSISAGSNGNEDTNPAKPEFEFFRKGVIGDYVNYFSDKEFHILKARYDERLSELDIKEFWDKCLKF